jgi:ATP-dependent DNA helicase 2 subunit 1
MDVWHFDDCFGERQMGTKFEKESNDDVKEAIIFLIDVASPEMHQGFNDPESNDAKLQMALKCVHATLRRKILESPNDIIGVLLYGTDRKICVNDFENLFLILPLDKPEGKSIQQIENYACDLEILRNNVGQFGIKNAKSILEALSQCQSLFNNVQGKVSSRRIWLFTTNDNPYLSEPCQTSSDLKEAGIRLEIMPLSKDFDFSKFYTPSKRFSLFETYISMCIGLNASSN